MSSSRFYSQWWFKLLVAPLLVMIGGTALIYLIVPADNNEINLGVKAGRDLNVSGDLVAGDKYEYNISSPGDFKSMDQQYVNMVKTNIFNLKSKYPESNLNILFQIINPNDATKKFAYEFQQIMGATRVPVTVVPHLVIGMPARRFPISFKYKNISRAAIIDYISGIDPLFSPEKGSLCIPDPKRDHKIAENFNLVIQIWEKVNFDSSGRIFFQ